MILPPAHALLIAKRTGDGLSRYTFKITGPAGSAVISVTDPLGFEARVGQAFEVDAELVRPGPTMAPDLLFAFRPIPHGGRTA